MQELIQQVIHLLAQIAQVGQLLKKDLALVLFARLEPGLSILMALQFVLNAVQELIHQVIHLVA